MIDSISERMAKLLLFFAGMTFCVTFLSNSALNVSFLLFGMISIFSMRLEVIRLDKKLFVITALFFISGLISNLYNFNELHNVSKSFRGLRFFFFAPFLVSAFFYLFQYIQKKPIRQSKALNWFLILTSIASISGLIGLVTGFNYLRMKPINHAIRNSGMYGMYMTYAYGISLFLTLNIGALTHYKRFKTFLSLPVLLVSAIINFVGLYFSYTRGALLGLIFSIPFLLVKSKKQLFLLLLGFSIVFSGFVFFTDSGKKLFFDSKRLRSNQQRIAFFKGALFGVKESPVFGLGVKNIEPNMRRLKEKYNLEDRKSGHSHNMYLEVMANQGFVGFLTLLVFFAYSINLFSKISGTEGYLAVGFFANFCLSGLFQNTFGDSENLQFMIIIWALFVAWYLINKRSYLKSL